MNACLGIHLLAAIYGFHTPAGHAPLNARVTHGAPRVHVRHSGIDACARGRGRGESGGTNSTGATLDMSFSAFLDEARRRGLDKFERLRTKGPHAETSPRTVIEFVLTSLQQGDVESAFKFTALPPGSGGRGMANAPLDKRIDWFTARVIKGNPTGNVVNLDEFTALVRDRLRFVMDSNGFTFVGAAPKWGKPHVPVHADQEYFVEVGSALVRIYLTYQWLFTCHVVTGVQVLRAPAEGYAGLPDADTPAPDL